MAPITENRLAKGHFDRGSSTKKGSILLPSSDRLSCQFPPTHPQGNWAPQIHTGLLLVMWLSLDGYAQVASRFATEDSRADYVHRIELYDHRNSLIRPDSTKPYSPSRTCGRCHDVDQISHGFHFSADADVQAHGRPSEPFIWVDATTGTQLPLSHRGWKNSFAPDAVGVSTWDFVLRFGTRTAGGHPVPLEGDSLSAGAPIADRFHLSGALEVDCMVCHARSPGFDMEAWTKQVGNENFAWASTAAIGLARIDGMVRRLPDDFDPTAEPENSRRTLPKTTYDPHRFDAEGKVLLDIVRFPEDNACYRCHSTLAVGGGSSPAWTHEGDVHLKSGMKCVDCHPNGLRHETVRGFEGAVHPSQQHAATLSCRGCHIGPKSRDSSSNFAAGGMGAPYPEHKGLPPYHLERLSCTACHSGPLPKDTTHVVHTARGHLLGQKGHRSDHLQPEIVEPILLPDKGGKLYPHRVMWPSYWASDNRLEPLNVDTVQKTLKGELRVRRNFLEELTKVHLTPFQKAKIIGEERASVPLSDLTEEEHTQLEKLVQSEAQRMFRDRIRKALIRLRESLGAEKPVYVAGKILYRLDDSASLVAVDNPQPQPYSWPIAHDVRPARRALGANGCADCHAHDSPVLVATVTAEGPIPSADLVSHPMFEYAGVDASLWYWWAELLRLKPMLVAVLAVSASYLTYVILRRGGVGPA